MKILLDQASQVTEGVWLTAAPPHQLTMLSDQRFSRGPRSVLLAQSPTFDRDRGYLLVDAEQLVVLNLGSTPTTVVIDATISAEAAGDSETERHATLGELGPGDREFRSLAERELHGEAQEAAIDLIHEVRRRWGGDLKRGERNNFSNTPDNFWYVIVQPRVQALSVTVRGTRDKFREPKLELRPDRPGYTRFIVRSPDEVPEALRLIEQSKRK